MQTKEEKEKYRQGWVKRNRARHNATTKAWADRNREKHLAIQRASYHRNKEKNREKRLANALAWYYKNKERILVEKKERYTKLVLALRTEIFSAYKAVCNCCGIDEKTQHDSQ